MSLRIRIARPGDSAAVASLRRAWTEEQAGEPIDDDGFDGEFDSWFAREADQRVTWLAEDGDDPVGMLNMLVFTRMPRPRSASERRPKQWGYIANFYVRADWRNAGVGRMLLDEAVEHADDHGFARIVLSPSELSVPLYARAGFVPATSLMIRHVSADDRPVQRRTR
ncbi:MAG: GNAT family N-acetyltransferase [Nocardioidaceae bacterium]